MRRITWDGIWRLTKISGWGNVDDYALLLYRFLKIFLSVYFDSAALSSESVGQVDIELKKGISDDEDDDSDSDDDSSNVRGDDKIRQFGRKNALISESKGEGENDDDEEETASEPMIQIQFALTDPNNPLVELFSNDKEKKGDESENCRDEDDQQEGPSKVRAVKSMLKSTSSTKKEEQPPKIRLLSSDNPTPKQSLITELS